MTVNPSDIPEFEESDDDNATEVFPFSLMEAGDFGDFRPIVLPADAEEPGKD